MASGDKRVNYSWRFFWFALAIVAAGCLYTAGWFYAADRLVERVDASVAVLNGGGRRANCEDTTARGFPFRIGVFCRSVMFMDAGGGFSFRAREFRSAAQVYQPNHVIGELDGPAALEAPGLSALELDWESMRASMRLASPLPDRLSVVGTKVAVRLDQAGDLSPPLGHAETAELHMRPAGEGIDVAARFSGLTLDANLVGTNAVPPLSGLADIFVQGRGPGLRGKSGTLRTVAVSLDEETGATVAGPFSVDADGLIDAQLKITLRNPEALGAILIELMPEARDEIELGLSALSAMGEAPTLPLRIEQSEMSLGFLSLGSIPPL